MAVGGSHNSLAFILQLALDHRGRERLSLLQAVGPRWADVGT